MIPRRKCAGVLILLVAMLAGCRTETPQAAYDRIHKLYLSGDLTAAANAAALEAHRRERTASDPWLCKFRLLAAEALLAQSKPAEAVPWLDRVIPATAAYDQLELRRQSDLAEAAWKSRRSDEALATIARIRPAVKDPDLMVRLDVLEGAIHASRRELDPAEQILRRAETEAHAQSNAYQEASALLNLSSCRKWRYRYTDAVDYGLRALAIAEKNGFRRLAAVEDASLGSFYRFLGQFDAAAKYEEQAVRQLRTIGDRSNLLVAEGELGLLYDVQGREKEAIAEYEQAFELAVAMNRNLDAARNAVNCAEAYIKLQDWANAREWNDKSRRLAPAASESGPYQTLNDAGIALGQGRPDDAIAMYQQVAQANVGSPSLAWESHYELAGIFSTQKNYGRAESEYRAAVDAIDKARSDLLSPSEQITFLARLIAIHRDYVDLEVARNNDRAALRLIEASRARVLAERLGRNVVRPADFDPGKLIDLARTSKVWFISYWLAPRLSFAWLIGPTGLRRFDLPAEAEIEPLVTAYRKVVEHSLRDPIAGGDPNGPKLWNILLRDIAPAIPKDARVILVPDGPLHLLNFETLPVPGARPHYWIEDVELAIAPSLAIAASAPPAAAPGSRSLLLIGAPDYTGTDYPPVENAGVEIDDIRRHFPDARVTVYTGSAASPNAWRDSAPGRFTLIHFAAHAEASNSSPLESAVILAKRGDSYKLYARDVIDTPIHADLVTISACQSAGVRAYAGEGLIGFAWAFLDAGARTVVAGLWDVSDTSTEPLMDRFYSGIAAGEDPVTAMRTAKLALQNARPDFRKPYYWAPFQVYVRSARRDNGIPHRPAPVR